MGKIIFDIWFFCYRYGSNYRDNKIPLGYCEKMNCRFFKGVFFNNENGDSGILCDLKDIERKCNNCLYEHNAKDDNTCGRCGGNRSNWSPNKIILCKY